MKLLPAPGGEDKERERRVLNGGQREECLTGEPLMDGGSNTNVSGGFCEAPMVFVPSHENFRNDGTGGGFGEKRWSHSVH